MKLRVEKKCTYVSIVYLIPYINRLLISIILFIIMDTLKSTYHDLHALFSIKLKWEGPRFSLLINTRKTEVSIEKALRIF